MPSRPTIPASTSPRRALAVFLLSGLVVLGVVGGVLAVVQQRTAVTEAVRDARTLALLQARDVVEPLLTDAALRPGVEFDRLDAVVRDRVLGEQVVRVKVWDATGRVVYSDDPALVGRRFDLPPDELAALGPGGSPVAEVSDLDEAENAGERSFGKLLQVYLGVQTAQGTPLLFETYQPYDGISSASRRLWLNLLPVLLGGLALLWLAQAPLAWRLATSLRAAQESREQLLLSALAASDRERQRIAADLHDGVVQGLSGASYTLSAAAARATARGEPESAATAEQVAVDLRRSVRELRSLVVTITPPGMRRQPLVPSLHDLAAPLQDSGVAVTLELDDVEADDAARDLVLRATQEAVRNVLRHAGAAHAVIRLSAPDSHLVLEVTDDGDGFAPGAGRRDSVGLSLLAGLAEQEGGSLDVLSEPGHGTRVVLRLPRSSPATSDRSAHAAARAGVPA
ncbi:MAG: integral rane sensor signal transduction histidine kinase [Frankiales bacterium]|nr:integral rane sensor signal transduction histidine kinase [Frankiales bacterium]